MLPPMKLAVTTFTRKVLMYEYGSDHVYIGHNSPLLPHLTTAPRKSKRHLKDHIVLVGKDYLINDVRPDAGHNLYVAQMAQLVDWISMHASLDMGAYTWMNHFYDLTGLEDDDLPKDRTYKQWQRHEKRKKRKNYLYNPSKPVLKNTSHIGDALKLAMEDAGTLIQSHPDYFFRADDQPDMYMIKKAMVYVMADRHDIDQVDIAGCFDITQQAVSLHLRDFRSLYQKVLS